MLNPWALGGGAAGAAGGAMAGTMGGSFSPLSMLDAPGRGARSALLAMLGRPPEAPQQMTARDLTSNVATMGGLAGAGISGDPSMGLGGRLSAIGLGMGTKAMPATIPQSPIDNAFPDQPQPRETGQGSFVPAMAGLAAGLGSTLVPGLQPLAPMIGAAATGLAQMLGEAIDPINYDTMTPSELTTRMGVGGSGALDFLAGAATDPLTYAGAISGGNASQVAQAGQGVATRAAGMFRGMVPAEAGAPSAASLASAEGRLGSYAEQMANARPPIPQPGQLPTPPQLPALGGPSNLGAPTPPRPLNPAMQAAQESSLAGYNQELLAQQPELSAYLNATPKQYKRVNPAVSGPMQNLSWMDTAGSQAGGGRLTGGSMPPFAQVRGGSVVPNGAVPQAQDYMDLLAQQPQNFDLSSILQQLSPAQERQMMLQRLMAMNAGNAG